MGKRLGVGIVLAVAVAGAIAWWSGSRSGSRSGSGSGSGSESESESASGSGAASAPAERHSPVVDRARADKMREEIRRLLAEAGPFVGTAAATGGGWNGPVSATGRPLAPMPAPAGASGDGGVDPLAAYIRDRIREDFIPLAGKCYENELAKNPKLAGRAVVKFRIVGDKRVGGVVDSAELDEKKSELLAPSFVQCMSESMMSVSFGAPPDGHPETTVEYPFAFSPDDEPDAAPPR